MALPASGSISYNEINIELGSVTGSIADMNVMTAAALGSATITDQPDNISDWYAYTHILPPNPPTADSDSISGGNITLNWTEGAIDATHDNEDLYRIQETTNDGSGWSAWTNVSTSGQDTVTKTYATFGLLGDLVRIQIRAENVSGNSAWSIFPTTLVVV